MEADARMAAATETPVRPSPESRTLRDRLRGATAWLLAAPQETEHAADTGPLRRLRWGLAIAIVCLSIFSAIALWRASVHEEHASQSDVQFRQEAVLLQQLDRTAVDAIFEDISVFGSYEEHRALHDRLVVEAARTRDAALARRLTEQARSEQRLAELQIPAFQMQVPTVDGTRIAYDASVAYRGAVAFDLDRAALQPAEHRDEATAERNNGVWLTLVAALFLAALLCMTLAQVSLAAGPKDQPPPRFGAAAVLGGFGLLIALSALVVFSIENW